MDSLDSGVGYGAVPLAEETQQRLGPAASLTSRLAFQHALFEDIVEDRVILDVESKITHCCHLFHDRRNGPAQLSENYQTCCGVAPGGGVEFRKTRQDSPDVLASIAVPGIELARHLPPAPLDACMGMMAVITPFDKGGHVAGCRASSRCYHSFGSGRPGIERAPWRASHSS